MTRQGGKRPFAWVRPWMLVALVTILYLAVVLHAHGGDPLALATLGTRFSEGAPAGTEGYDGQFNYYIARDPLGARDLVDIPAYRYQRSLYPLLARILALGQAGWIPYTLPLINVLALAGGTWCVEEILRRYHVNRWYAVTLGLYAGQLMSARLDLAEPLSYALVVAAILSAERDRWGWAVALFALSALARETSLVFVGGYLFFLVAQRNWRHALGLALGAGLPWLGWQIILWAWLGQPGFGSGGAGATPWEAIPFRGFWSIGAVDLRAFALLALIVLPLTIVPGLLALWSAARDLWAGRWHPFTAMLLANAAILLFLPQSSYREPLAMLRLTTGLVLAMILYGARKRSQRILNYSLLWLASLVFLFKE
ncbi:MAG: hypothetical protein JXA93_00190 [Anaerolineae bacterium]|nr:hypothetical protein [Anaerolineae bacterium]